MHAAIVAGGKGTRAAGMTSGLIPKALLPVGGVPIIVRQMRVLKREGVSQLTVLAGHLGDQLQQALAPEARKLGLALRIIVEQMPLGTAGCLAALNPLPKNDVLIVYGDMLFDIAVQPLYEFHQTHGANLTLVAHPNDHPRTSDLIVEEDGLVKAILPVGQSRANDYRNLVPTGLYLATSAFLAGIEHGRRADMIRDVLPRCIASGAKLMVYNSSEYMRDVGSAARHALAEHDLAAGRVDAMNRHHLRPTIFLDCDGVLNDEPGLNGAITADDLHLIPGAGAALRRARDAGLLTVAVTNRSQVAKGFVTLEGLSHILGRLEALLAEEGGVLDRIYFCPHHPEAGFAGEISALKVKCECRKPGTLLLRRAFADLPIDRRRSALIGDSLRDIGAARGVGIWAYGVRTGHGCRDSKQYESENGSSPTPDLIFDNVCEAVDFQMQYEQLAAPIVSVLARLTNAKPRPILVGLCGRSRAGKSSVAHAIVRVLVEKDISCLHVHLDNWILPAAERSLSGSAEDRNRVDAIPDVVRALRAGNVVHAPGYNALSRGPGEAVTYDPGGKSVIVIDGLFAGHHTIRDMLDFVAFVEAPVELKQSRFLSFYRWKGLAEDSIETLWRHRSVDEWSAVDAQRHVADLILTSGAAIS